MAELIFSQNETVALMHRDSAFALRSIADLIDKFKMDREEIIDYLREVADSKEAQAIVVELRDEL